VLIENFAPGVMGRLGLGYEAMRQVNSALVYLSSCNMGQTGPKASQRGFGSQLTSQSGFTYLAGYDDEDPMLLFGPYIDFVAVGFGLIAVLAALDYRRRTGQGQYVDLAQYETGLQFIQPALLDYEANGRVTMHHGNRDASAAPHNAYPCRGDDWCAIAVFSDDEWRALCKVAGSTEWASEVRFGTHESRKQNEDELDDAIAQWTRDWDAHELMEKLQAAGVEAMVINTVGDLFSDPQLQHRNIWRELPHAELGTFHYEAPPYDLSDSPAVLRASPLLGEHNRYVYGELLGMTDEEIEGW
jgi:crotonobetainyl-CoA:carnitine CoA-transferase CaiB-like acyl-CoA transferase